MPALRALFLLCLLCLLSPQFAMAGALPVGTADMIASAQPQHAANSGHDTRCAGHTSICVELDCSTCHSHGAAMVPSGAVPQWLAPNTAPASATQHSHASPWHERPYRPKWAALSQQG